LGRKPKMPVGNPLSYYKCLPIQPGACFFKSLLEYQDKLRRLQVNIPLTTFTTEEINYIARTSIFNQFNIPKR